MKEKPIFDWIVERNFGVRWITDRKTGEVVVDNLTKEQAFSIVDKHNKSIDIALKEQAEQIFDFIEEHYSLGYKLEMWKELREKYR